MKSFIPTRVAEIFFALAIGTFGVLHFMEAETMGVIVPDFMPVDEKIWVYIIGSCLIAAALAILINKFKKIACYLLATLLLIFVFTIHLKPALEGNMGQLLKDTSLAMAAIIIGNRSSK